KLRFPSLRRRLIHWTNSCILRTPGLIVVFLFCAISSLADGGQIEIEAEIERGSSFAAEMIEDRWERVSLRRGD
ncbi:hypothetical protein, partial [uncultured Dialister sp.]|uniref:hypothetical protein n=1 Tax=uncultured Dialister sp. TaxID=278064 RepID=UPI0025E2C074